MEPVGHATVDLEARYEIEAGPQVIAAQRIMWWRMELPARP